MLPMVQGVLRRWNVRLTDDNGHEITAPNPEINEDANLEDVSEPAVHPASISRQSYDYHPSVWDVLKVRFLLQRIGALPTEIVDEIIDAAEYWPSTTTTMASADDESHRIIRKDRDQVLVKTVPLCYDRTELEQSPDNPRSLPHRSRHQVCRKIVFRLSSHDQGPGQVRPNMYHESWTWFDAEVIRGAHAKNMFANGEEQELLEDEKGEYTKHFGPDDRLLLPHANKLQSNGGRCYERQDVEIIWHYQDDIEADSPEASLIESRKGRGRATLDGRVVREMEVGDSIAVWARARFPGWSNHVYGASVTVFWAI
ncbi:uncharacterized protein N7482_005367 [Penicillium canariense]|uniref:Uncharacterized protein n=1 Tax=Penicillium canariense TaxID=189055 RepID=A0A9W9LMY0_9EURO|nr:uncharacterized protein N7482_005367 [Penicillium canariense]KAJ5166586.1 hypothetical protein N7482_005367 [Penicillium canariense]